MKNPPNCDNATYFPIQQRWRKLKPIFASSAHIWRPNMEDFRQQKADTHGFKYTPDSRDTLPRDHDSCDWRWCREGQRGRHPAFWDYVCHSACHWVADMCLYVAQIADPKTPWRVVSSQKHSTVWNGDMERPVLFDTNFLALGVSAPDALRLASRGGRALKPAQWLHPWNLKPR